ncbi:uncharacterized protein [Centruroides vittatus]|uniref:uncharacterized protein n=1 Tax=Centruroides vittatus TaxID=120091 RepID=UPI0035102FC3
MATSSGSLQDRSVHFCALCLQTSALTSVPHRITGFLKFIDLSYKIDSITCSCKAGQSGKCKHCLAVLLFLNRNNIEGLEKLSKTDLECSWNRLKENVQSNYEIIPIKKFCHTGSNNSRIALNIDSEKCLNILTEAIPNSSLTKHMKGQKSLASLSKMNREINRVDQNNDVNAIFSHIQNFSAIGVFNCNKLYYTSIIKKELILTFKNIGLEDLPKSLMDYYKNKVMVSIEECKRICLESKVNKILWKKERSKRITGSIYYNFYTYHFNFNPNWNEKFSKRNIFWGNENTAYGLLHENDARQLYSSHSGKRIVEFGLIISPALPWLGYTPDGIIMKQNIPTSLLEIKCPVKGRNEPIQALIQKNVLKFITINGENVELRKRDKYYGQVQLGLLLTNLPVCDFVIYSSFDNSFISFEVKKDDEFLNKFISVLKEIYFNKMLPFLFTESNE